MSVAAFGLAYLMVVKLSKKLQHVKGCSTDYHHSVLKYCVFNAQTVATFETLHFASGDGRIKDTLCN